MVGVLGRGESGPFKPARTRVGPHLLWERRVAVLAQPPAGQPTPRLDRPETANWLAGRSPPSKADRARGVSPHEVAGYARTFKGRGPTLSDDDYRTRSWLRLGAGHRAGIQNPRVRDARDGE